MPKTVHNAKKLPAPFFNLNDLNLSGLLSYDAALRRLYNTGLDSQAIGTQYAAVVAKIPMYDAHLGNFSNPHLVSKSQVGLGSVDNESKATMFTNPVFTGATTTFATTESFFSDNLIEINYLEAGVGITGGFGGPEFFRGAGNYRFGFSEAVQGFTSGAGGSFYRVMTQDIAPANNSIPIWSAAQGKFIAGGIIADYATVTGGEIWTGKTFNNPTTIDGSTSAAVSFNGANLWIDTTGKMTLANAASTFALAVRDRDILFRNETVDTNYFRLTNYYPTIGWDFVTDTVVSGLFAGVNADSKAITEVSGFNFKEIVAADSATDTVLTIAPRIGYTGIGYAEGESIGFPSRAQTESVYSFMYNRTGLGIGVPPFYPLHSVSSMSIVGKKITAGYCVVEAGATIRAGNAVEITPAGFAREHLEAKFTPGTVGTVITPGAGTFISATTGFLASKRYLALYVGEADSRIYYSLININGGIPVVLAAPALLGSSTSTRRLNFVNVYTHMFIISYTNAGGGQYLVGQVAPQTGAVTVLSEGTFASADLPHATVMLTQSKGMFIFATGLDSPIYCEVFEVSGSGVLTGTADQALPFASTNGVLCACALNTGSVFVTYVDSIPIYGCLSITIVGSVVSQDGAPATPAAVTQATQPVCSAMTTTTAFLLYGNPAGGLSYTVATIGGGPVVFGAAQVVTATGSLIESVQKLRDDRIAICYRTNAGLYPIVTREYDSVNLASPFLTSEVTLVSATYNSQQIGFASLGSAGNSAATYMFTDKTARTRVNLPSIVESNIDLSYQKSIVLYAAGALTGPVASKHWARLTNGKVIITYSVDAAQTSANIQVVKKVGDDIFVGIPFNFAGQQIAVWSIDQNTIEIQLSTNGATCYWYPGWVRDTGVSIGSVTDSGWAAPLTMNTLPFDRNIMLGCVFLINAIASKTLVRNQIRTGTAGVQANQAPALGANPRTPGQDTFIRTGYNTATQLFTASNDNMYSFDMTIVEATGNVTLGTYTASLLAAVSNIYGVNLGTYAHLQVRRMTSGAVVGQLYSVEGGLVARGATFAIAALASSDCLDVCLIPNEKFAIAYTKNDGNVYVRCGRAMIKRDGVSVQSWMSATISFSSGHAGDSFVKLIALSDDMLLIASSATAGGDFRLHTVKIMRELQIVGVAIDPFCRGGTTCRVAEPGTKFDGNFTIGRQYVDIDGQICRSSKFVSATDEFVIPDGIYVGECFKGGTLAVSTAMRDADILEKTL